MTDRPLSPADRPLLDAAERGDLDAVRATLAAGASVGARDADGTTARAHAERRGFPDIAAALRAAEGQAGQECQAGQPG
ncbi:ankyrin repeat domain-containing protein [Kitasatospora sp. NPDC004669]|uniref:ankyrin repeat domain-containing protein n=1 Tax=Kitasatospora sp. NPDC004669 TaxID=3154555 RepID=UPI00339DCD9C